MSKIVVDELLAYLVAQGVAQVPATEPVGVKPSIWLMPREGAAMPRSKDGVWLETQTVTLNDENLMGPPGQEAWLKDAFVDVTVRSKNASEGKLLHRLIEGLLAPIGILGGRKDWVMNTLRVQSSSVWRQEQPLPPVDGGLTYDRVASYRIRCARSDLG